MSISKSIIRKSLSTNLREQPIKENQIKILCVYTAKELLVIMLNVKVFVFQIVIIK